MRKLASIQRITAIAPIEGADKIEVATVLGWSVVVVKGQFKVGDLVVYVEIDSILPDRPEFEFLRERKFRVRTIRLKGQVSQGICFPLSVLKLQDYYKEGDDVTTDMGVVKYDPQLEAERKYALERTSIHKNRMDKFFKRYAWYRRLLRPDRLPFPNFIKKTDEDRIQLFPEICETEKDTMFQVTEKIDGTSATYFLVRNKGLSALFKPYIFGVCSRNFQILKSDNSPYWDVAKKYNIESVLRGLFGVYSCDTVVIQGEIIGPKIQGNKYKRVENEFYVFNCVVGPWYVDNYPLQNMVAPLKTVPMLGLDWILPPTIKEALESANGKSKLSDVEREGLVWRNYDKGISFKVVSPNFLLKYE
jgi:hypothetical protein